MLDNLQEYIEHLSLKKHLLVNGGNRLEHNQQGMLDLMVLAYVIQDRRVNFLN